MKSFVRYLFPLLFLLLSSCAALQEPLRPDQLSYAPLDFEVPVIEQIELPNGIRLYLHEDHELPLVEISAMVGTGTLVDPADKTGMADLFAALLRTGGAGQLTPEAFDRRLEQMAADFVVSADSYTTTMELSLRQANLAEGLSMLAEALRHPGFDPYRFELARRQAVELVRRQDDQPGAVASRALMRALYGEHPLGRTPTVESLQAVTREDLVQLHRRSVHPDNLWLGITGDFDSGKLRQTLAEIFGDWQTRGGDVQVIPPLVDGAPAAVWVAEKDIPQTSILFGEVGVDKDNPDLQPIRVMNFILGGGGFNSRLMREVRSNRGLAYSVYSYFQVGRWLPGPFIAGCETKSESTAAVVRLMREIMEDMRRTPVSDEELQLAKESLINSFVFAFTDSHQVVAQQMRLDYYNYPEGYLQTYRDKIAEVTVDDVLRVAQTYLHPDRQSLVLVGKTGSFDSPPEAFGLPVRTITSKSP